MRFRTTIKVCGLIFLVIGVITMIISWNMGLVPVLCALPFPVIGLCMLIAPVIKEKRAKALKEDAIVIHASYVDTVINRRITVNHRHPYNIICRWENPVTGEVREFISDNYWSDPSYIIAEKCIQYFPVYISRDNSSKYIVDLSELKN